MKAAHTHTVGKIINLKDQEDEEEERMQRLKISNISRYFNDLRALSQHRTSSSLTDDLCNQVS